MVAATEAVAVVAEAEALAAVAAAVEAVALVLPVAEEVAVAAAMAVATEVDGVAVAAVVAEVARPEVVRAARNAVSEPEAARKAAAKSLSSRTGTRVSSLPAARKIC